ATRSPLLPAVCLERCGTAGGPRGYPEGSGEPQEAGRGTPSAGAWSLYRAISGALRRQSHRGKSVHLYLTGESMIGVAIAIRVLHVGAAIALTGSWTFPLLIVRPALQQAGERDWAAWPHFDRLLLRVGGWSLVGFGGASVLGFWDQCARVTQRSFVTLPPWEEVGACLLDTHYGRVWLLRLCLAVLLGGVLLLSTRQHHGASRVRLRLAGAVLASGLLGAQSL